MFGELPKVFGKEFVVGYLLPAAMLAAVGTLIAVLSDSSPIYELLKKEFLEADEKKLALNLGAVLLLIWAFAIFLLAVNFKLIRILEGYGAANPARLLKWRSVLIFDRLTARIDCINKMKPVPDDCLIERRRLRMRLADEFPEERRLILPTRFGNVIRAFERYPQIIYNMDAIRSWVRLQAVLPDSYKNSLDAAKAVLDFFVNLWFGSALIATTALVKIGLIVVARTNGEIWCTMTVVAVSAVLSAVLTAKWAQSAAAQWGELVKGAFDLYRGDLCQQLGFELPRSIERERQMWAPICRTMIYRQARYANEFTVFRPLEGRKSAPP